MSKRRAPEFNNGESKRRETTEKRYTVRLLIPTKLGGKLIGKSGSVASALRTTHGVSLNIPDSRCPERLVHIRGDELDGVVNCVQEIGEKLQQDINQIANLKNEEFTEVRMLIHKSICGAIIGKGGETIKVLREDTGTAIRMNGDCCPNSTDRVCQIAGEPGNVGAAMESILNTLENSEIRGDEQWYNVNDYNPEFINRYGGFKGEDGERYGRPGDDGGRGPPNRGPPQQHQQQYPPRQDNRGGPAPPASWQPPPNYPYPMPQYQQPQGHYPPPHAYSPYGHAPPAGYGAPPPGNPYYPPPPSGAYAQPNAGGDYYRQQQAPPPQAYGQQPQRGGYERRDNRDNRRDGGRNF